MAGSPHPECARRRDRSARPRRDSARARGHRRAPAQPGESRPACRAPPRRAPPPSPARPSGCFALEVARLDRLRSGAQLAALVAPAAQAAVQDRHRVVAEMSQQPPEACGSSLGGLVVGHDERVLADAGAAGGRLEGPGASGSGWRPRSPGGAGEVAVEVQVRRARDVALQPEPLARRPARRACSGSPRRGAGRPLRCAAARAATGARDERRGHSASTFRQTPAARSRAAGRPARGAPP